MAEGDVIHLDRELSDAVDSERIQIYLSGDVVANLADNGTYYTFKSPNMKSDLSNGFSFDNSTGEITYNGTASKVLRFLGASDVSTVSTPVANTVTFAIFKNGILYGAGSETPTSFTSIDRLKNIGINRLIHVNPGDKISVSAKGSIDNITLTAKTLYLTIF